MYPTISDFLHDIIGINIPLPIQTYGFFVALTFITGAYVLSLEFKRKEKEGLMKSFKKKILVGAPASISSLAINGFIGFLVGFKLIEAIFNYSEFVAHTQTFILSSRGNIFGGILIGAASAYYTYWEKNKKKLKNPKWEEQVMHPHEISGNLLVIAGIAGILGAKLFHNLENLDELIANPIESIFSFSGLTFFGGLICAVISVIWYCKLHGIKPLHVGDVGGVIIPLGYAIGRMGCHISGDGCWGIPNPSPKPSWMSFLPDWMWSYNYPHNVVNEGVLMDNCTGAHCHVLNVPVFPTSFYEASFMLLIFGVLWMIRKRVKLPGVLFFIYLFLAGIERFIVEQIRVNNKLHMGGLEFTQAQMISTIMMLLGIAGLIYLFKNKEKLKNY